MGIEKGGGPSEAENWVAPTIDQEVKEPINLHEAFAIAEERFEEYFDGEDSEARIEEAKKAGELFYLPEGIHSKDYLILLGNGLAAIRTEDTRDYYQEVDSDYWDPDYTKINYEVFSEKDPERLKGILDERLNSLRVTINNSEYWNDEDEIYDENQLLELENSIAEIEKHFKFDEQVMKENREKKIELLAQAFGTFFGSLLQIKKAGSHSVLSENGKRRNALLIKARDEAEETLDRIDALRTYSDRINFSEIIEDTELFTQKIANGINAGNDFIKIRDKLMALCSSSGVTSDRLEYWLRQTDKDSDFFGPRDFLVRK